MLCKKELYYSVKKIRDNATHPISIMAKTLLYCQKRLKISAAKFWFFRKKKDQIHSYVSEISENQNFYLGYLLTKTTFWKNQDIRLNVIVYHKNDEYSIALESQSQSNVSC